MKRATLVWDNIHVYRVSTYGEQYDLEITHASEYSEKICMAVVHILYAQPDWYIMDMFDEKDNTWI